MCLVVGTVQDVSTTPVLILDVSSLCLSAAAGTLVVSTAGGLVLSTQPGSLTERASIYNALAAARTHQITVPGPDGKATPAHIGLYIPRTGHVTIGDHTYQLGLRPIAPTGLPATLEGTTLYVDETAYQPFTIDAASATNGWAAYRN